MGRTIGVGGLGRRGSDSVRPVAIVARVVPTGKCVAVTEETVGS